MRLPDFKYIFVIFLLFFAASCSSGDDQPVDPNPEPSLDPPRVYFVNPSSDIEVIKGESVTFELRVRGTVDSYELSIEGQTVTSGNDFADFNYTHDFDTEGTYTLSLTASNEAGTSTETLSVTVLPTPPTKAELLAGTDSKRWKFISLIRNEDEDLTYDYEKDNVLELFRETRTERGEDYNFEYHYGDLEPAPSEKGMWKLVIDDLYISMDSLHNGDNARIVELTQTTLTYSIRVTETTTLYYNYEVEE